MKMGEKLTILRKARGLSQEDLAGKIGVSRQSVSKWESGQSVPEIEKVILLSDFLGVTTDYLLKENDEPIAAGTLVRRKPDARIFMAVATALDVLSILLFCLLCRGNAEIAWVTWLVLLTAGMTVYAVGMLAAPAEMKKRMSRRFWMANLWAVGLLPAGIFNALLNRGWIQWIFSDP
ncbi:MAG: helix-turn-helix transcriptional regulator [Clostridiaceae bacterium]|nr:helix-turn-helix transcriptional regulator [Clostridiaceae bacterium]